MPTVTSGARGIERDFLTVGSMGHCSQIALGVAQHVPARDVYCLDGDGAVLMHMGSLAIIGTQAPPNLRHVVINNGAHDSVGGQPTAAREIDLCAVALGLPVPVCGVGRRRRWAAGGDGAPPGRYRPGHARGARRESCLHGRRPTRDITGREQGRLHGGALVWRRIAAGSTRTRRASWSAPARAAGSASGRSGELSSSPHPVRPNAALTERVSRLLDTGSVLVHDRVEPNPTVDRLDSTIDAASRRHRSTRSSPSGAAAHRHRQGPRPRACPPRASVSASSSRARCPPTPSRRRSIAVPTTAGTGSEVTPFATVWDAADARKLSVADPRLFPSVALVDADARRSSSTGSRRSRRGSTPTCSASRRSATGTPTPSRAPSPSAGSR